MEDFENEWKSLKLLDNESHERLERFAKLFAKSLDLIVTALSTNKTIPHEVFRIRDYFSQEICDCELECFLDFVQALFNLHKRETAESEELTKEETVFFKKLDEFFKKEEG